MDWIPLESIQQLEEINQESATRAVAIFKHSTRCSISAMAKGRLERDWPIEQASTPIYYLDLIAHRDVSNEIAHRYGVQHESPQLLFVKDSQVQLVLNHNSIQAGIPA